MSGLIGVGQYSSSGIIGQIPYFSVKQTGQPSIGANTMFTFNETVTDKYGGWDGSDEYTIPVAGLWHFVVALMLNTTGSTSIRVFESAIFVDGTEVSNSSVTFADPSSGSGNHPGLNVIATYPCEKGDVIKSGNTGHIDPTSGISMRGGDCRFYGTMISNKF
tara:strand:+ start:379 stop:864 length:486 start_codon:yes stop_codon:yes gene_type:complete